MKALGASFEAFTAPSSPWWWGMDVWNTTRRQNAEDPDMKSAEHLNLSSIITHCNFQLGAYLTKSLYNLEPECKMHM